MKQNSVWGTRAEIVAAAILYNKPVFVALQKNDKHQDYYWAKYACEPNDNLECTIIFKQR